MYKQAPTGSGVYVIMNGTVPVYAGASRNLHERLFGSNGHMYSFALYDEIDGLSLNGRELCFFHFGIFLLNTYIRIKYRETKTTKEAFDLEKKIINRIVL